MHIGIMSNTRSRQADWQSRIRPIRMAQGLCAQCGGPRAAGTYRCHGCNVRRREAAKELMRRRRAAEGI